MEIEILRKLKKLRQKVSLELETNLVPFWLTHVKNSGEKGFTSWMSNDLVCTSASKGLVLHARLLWTFSSLYGFKRDLKYLKLAQECYVYLRTHFLDREFGGAYWQLSAASGEPEDRLKKTYGQVFLIYALSEFYKCHPAPSVLEECKTLFMHLEQHVLDKTHWGYYEICERDWTLAAHQQLSDKDMDERKSMNTHLHVLEAFTNLYSIWHNDLLKCRLTMLLEIFSEKIVQSPDGHLGLFFDDAWGIRSRGISFGHEIEASWLICEAAKVLGDLELLTRFECMGGMLAERVHAKGRDASGGLNYEITEQGRLDTDKHFWVQAEAAVGFLNAWEMTCQDEYLEAAEAIWDFIDTNLVDKQYGEWFWKVDADGIPDADEPKISDWKGPYHNVRACLETIHRIDTLLVRYDQQRETGTCEVSGRGELDSVSKSSLSAYKKLRSKGGTEPDAAAISNKKG